MYSDVDKFLRGNGIEYFNPQAGHYKIKTERFKTFMFYPKSNTVIWTKGRKAGDFQHKFTNLDRNQAFIKILKLLKIKLDR